MNAQNWREWFKELTKINEIDIELVKEYFKLFNKEALLNEWLNEIEQ